MLSLLIGLAHAEPLPVLLRDELHAFAAQQPPALQAQIVDCISDRWQLIEALSELIQRTETAHQAAVAANDTRLAAHEARKTEIAQQKLGQLEDELPQCKDPSTLKHGTPHPFPGNPRDPDEPDPTNRPEIYESDAEGWVSAGLR